MSKKYVGAYKRGRKWYAKITFQNITHNLGCFKNEKAAGEAYLKAKKLLEDQASKTKGKKVNLTSQMQEKCLEQLQLF